MKTIATLSPYYPRFTLMCQRAPIVLITDFKTFSFVYLSHFEWQRKSQDIPEYSFAYFFCLFSHSYRYDNKHQRNRVAKECNKPRRAGSSGWYMVYQNNSLQDWTWVQYVHLDSINFLKEQCQQLFNCLIRKPVNSIAWENFLNIS